MSYTREVASKLNPLICDTATSGTLQRVNSIISLLEDIAIHEMEIKDHCSWNGMYQIHEFMRIALQFEMEEGDRNGK